LNDNTLIIAQITNLKIHDYDSSTTKLRHTNSRITKRKMARSRSDKLPHASSSVALALDSVAALEISRIRASTT
jgi:hypothetical protein